MKFSITILIALGITWFQLIHVCSCRKPSEHDRLKARAFGYPEKSLSKLKLPILPPQGCSEKKAGDDFFSRFREFHEIENFIIDGLCNLREFIGSIDGGCSSFTIGTSLEGRKIWAIELLPPVNILSNADGTSIETILVLGTMHAREWTTTTSTLLSAVRLDVEKYRILFVPLVNPDGYAYTWSGQANIKKRYIKGQYEEVEVPSRLFRKNKRLNHDGSVGVDLNRNFGKQGSTWGVDTKSKSINLTSSDIYQGSRAFSEPETQALKNLFSTSKSKIVAVFDVHCCIPAVLEPFSLNPKGAPKYVEKVGRKIMKQMNTKAPIGEKYEWRARIDSTSSGSGLSTGFFFEDMKVPFVYVVELRGKFIMSCSHIKPLGTEVLLGLRALINEVKRYNGRPPIRKKIENVELFPTPQQENSTSFSKQSIFLFGVGISATIVVLLKDKSDRKNEKDEKQT